MLASLQYLRALAALMVAYYHLGWGIPEIYHLGARGVDIFFVISGFIMWYTTAGTPGEPVKFLRRRLLRILPLYWVATLLMFSAPLVSGTLAGGTSMDLGHLLASLVFVPWPYPIDPSRYYPVYVPGWTINYEMFFYAIFSVCLMFVTAQARLVGLGAAILAPVLVGLNFQTSGILKFYTSPIILEFLAGILIAQCFLRGLVLPLGPAIMAFAIGTVGIIIPVSGSDLLMVVFTGSAASLMVAGLTSWERCGPLPRSKTWRLLGDASYSIYLTHLFTLGALSVLWNRLQMQDWPFGSWLLPVIAILACAAVGVAVYNYIERPLGQWARPFILCPLKMESKPRSAA